VDLVEKTIKRFFRCVSIELLVGVEQKRQFTAGEWDEPFVLEINVNAILARNALLNEIADHLEAGIRFPCAARTDNRHEAPVFQPRGVEAAGDKLR
jgi:hypothetical protein